MGKKISFYLESSQRLEDIQHYLEALDKGPVYWESSLNEIYLNIHTLKGYADLFGKKNATEAFHEVESYIEASLKRDKKIAENQIATIKSALYPILIKFSTNEDLDVEQFKEVKNILKLQKKISQKSKPWFIDRESSMRTLSSVDELKKFTTRVCLFFERSTHKKISLKLDLEESGLTKHEFPLVQEIIFHLVKNSIEHSGKNKMVLKFSLKKTNYFKTMTYQDNGDGINVTALKKKLVSQKILPENEVEKLSPKDIILLLYKNKISSKDQKNFRSGRGLGMNILYRDIQKLEGQLEVDLSQPGFSIKFKWPSR
ncbi:MAG: hypothetical protein H6621_07620 [Halobacteriovoraceae bacterium]|nr:hypothetical protein [Halobacteriovoraceae bacterium]